MHDRKKQSIISRKGVASDKGRADEGLGMPASATRPPLGRGGPPCTTMSLFKEQFFGQPQRCGFEAEMWSGEGACFWFPVPDMGIRMAVWTKTRELPSSYIRGTLTGEVEGRSGFVGGSAVHAQP